MREENWFEKNENESERERAFQRADVEHSKEQELKRSVRNFEPIVGHERALESDNCKLAGRTSWL